MGDNSAWTTSGTGVLSGAESAHEGAFMTREITKHSNVSAMRRSLSTAKTTDDVIKVGAGVAGIEEMMRASGLYQVEELRPVRELWLDSRRKLGKLLRKIDKSNKGGRPKKNRVRAVHSYREELKRLNLTHPRALEVQRVSHLPPKETSAVYDSAKQQEILPTMFMLVEASEPFWYLERRKQRHKQIADDAIAAQLEVPEQLGPFPLIYADPPWVFETFTPKGHESHRMPDDHYPTLPDREIAMFQIGDDYVSDIAAKDAVLFLWCTSSNIFRAVDIMERWGFEYKTQAVWDKMQIGTGLIFRNQHEVLLCGARGKPPKPIELFSSVFRYPRGKHSAKPPEIRRAIERMYPFFDAPETKIELFARGQIEGWTCVGHEARGNGHAAAGVDQRVDGVGATVG